MSQDHSRKIIFIKCVYALNKNTHTKFELPSVYQRLRYRAHAPQLKLQRHFTKSPKCDNIYCVYGC